MIQDILYAIKYDKIKELKISRFYVENLEEKIDKGETFISNHPIIMCFENNKVQYLDFFLEKGFTLNCKHRGKSLLFNTLSIYKYQNLFFSLYEKGARF